MRICGFLVLGLLLLVQQALISKNLLVDWDTWMLKVIQLCPSFISPNPKLQTLNPKPETLNKGFCKKNPECFAGGII